MTILRMAAAFAAASVLTLSAAVAAGKLHTGQVAPPFTLPRDTSGTVSLASYHGKPVYLNFFASWCGPCVEESPYVRKLAEKYASKGLVTLGIDELEDPSKAAAFAAGNKVRYPVLVDQDGNVGQDYGRVGLPMHVFIDKKGNISLWRPGEMSEAEIEAEIQKIL